MNQALRICNTRTGIRFSLVCCTAVLLMMLSACGQNGPLFLPEETEAAPEVAEQAAEDAQEPGNGEEDEDRDGSRR